MADRPFRLRAAQVMAPIRIRLFASEGPPRIPCDLLELQEGIPMAPADAAAPGRPWRTLEPGDVLEPEHARPLSARAAVSELKAPWTLPGPADVVELAEIRPPTEPTHFSVGAPALVVRATVTADWVRLMWEHAYGPADRRVHEFPVATPSAAITVPGSADLSVTCHRMGLPLELPAIEERPLDDTLAAPPLEEVAPGPAEAVEAVEAAEFESPRADVEPAQPDAAPPLEEIAPPPLEAIEDVEGAEPEPPKADVEPTQPEPAPPPPEDGSQRPELEGPAPEMAFLEEEPEEPEAEAPAAEETEPQEPALFTLEEALAMSPPGAEPTLPEEEPELGEDRLYTLEEALAISAPDAGPTPPTPEPPHPDEEPEAPEEEEEPEPPEAEASTLEDAVEVPEPESPAEPAPPDEELEAPEPEIERMPPAEAEVPTPEEKPETLEPEVERTPPEPGDALAQPEEAPEAPQPEPGEPDVPTLEEALRVPEPTAPAEEEAAPGEPIPSVRGLTSDEVLSRLQSLAPPDFEALMLEALKHLGYADARITRRQPDGGFDAVGWTEAPEGSERFAIQCRHGTGELGIDAARDLAGIVSSEPAIDKGVLISTGELSRRCREFVRLVPELQALPGRALARRIREFGLELP